jgi:hypothetical protein
MGSYQKALEHTQKALTFFLKNMEPDHYYAVDAHNSMGIIRRELGHYDQALEHFNQALQSGIKTMGAKSPRIAPTHRNIGNLYCEMGSYEKALGHFQKSLALFEESQGATHVDTVAAYLELAHVLHELDRKDQAAQNLQKAWTNGQKVCAGGKARSCANAAVARCLLGDCDEQAMALAQKGITLAPKFTDTQEAMAFLLIKSGKLKEGKKIYCKLKSLGPLTQSASRQRVKQYCR